MAKLNLACANQTKEGYINHEIRKINKKIDIAWNLNIYPWPWKNNEFNEILAEDIIEHLIDTISFMDECHRILEKNGKLIIRTPSYDAKFAWSDPTHVKTFTIDSWDFFDPSTEYGRYNLHITDNKWKIIKKEKSDNNNLFIEMEKI
jgi:predicted SAM-dependent methyltransferase